LMSSFAGNISEVMAMASSSKRDIDHSGQYNSAYDDQTTDFLTFGHSSGRGSPDPVRRMIDNDSTIDTTLQPPTDKRRSADKSHHSNRSGRSSKSRDRSGHSSEDRPRRSSDRHRRHKSPATPPQETRHPQTSEPRHQRSTSTPVKQESPSVRMRSNSASRIPVPANTYTLPNSKHSTSQNKSAASSSAGHRSTRSSPAQSHRSNKSSPSADADRKSSPHSAAGSRRSHSPSNKSSSRGVRSTSPARSLGVTSSGRLSSINGAGLNGSRHSSSTGSMVAERFLEDQRQRTTALENLLDQHIQGLRDESHQLLTDTDTYLNSFT